MAEVSSQDASVQLAAQLFLRALSEQQKSVPQSQPAEADTTTSSPPKKKGKKAAKQKSQDKENEEEEVDTWPDSLCEGELFRLAEMGLGKAVDATQQQQWEKKTTYQAKEIASMDDLVVITEGFHKKRFADVIESYYELQANIGASVAIPNMPIQIGVAADAQRSFGSSQHISGTTIITRTIAFKTSPSTHGHTEHCHHGSVFEKHLEGWLKRKGCVDEEGKYDKDNSSSECQSFLRVLGGVTHYVSSITLGAMKYSTQTTVSTQTVTSSSASIGVQGAGSAKAGGKFTKGSSEKHERLDMIGQLPDKGGMIRPRSTAEAVIRFSITPLTNLVVNDDLRAHLENAIKQYMEVNSFKRRGPFNIISAEPIAGNKRVFWKVEKTAQSGNHKSTYRVAGTTNHEEASKFYIRPDPTDEKGVWFYITTAPEQMFAEAKDHLEQISTTLQEFTEETQSEEGETPEAGEGTTPIVQSQEPAGDKSTAAASDKHKRHSVGGADHKHPASSLIRRASSCCADFLDVERFLHIDLLYNRGYALRARSIVDRKKALFKLIDRVSHKSMPLKGSSWLPTPDSQLAGDPYFIQPGYRPGHHFFHRPVIAMAKETTFAGGRFFRRGDTSEDHFHVDLSRKCHESRLQSHLMLFVLINSKE